MMARISFTLLSLLLALSLLFCREGRRKILVEQTGGDDECYRRCMQSNMMRAVAAEVIENDCRLVCQTEQGR